MIISGTIGWIVAGTIYLILVVIGLIKEHRDVRRREQERAVRREQQNREWREQFNQLNPTIRAAIRLMREDQREVAQVIALLQHYNYQRSPRRDRRKEKIDWKKEGF